MPEGEVGRSRCGHVFSASKEMDRKLTNVSVLPSCFPSWLSPHPVYDTQLLLPGQCYRIRSLGFQTYAPLCIGFVQFQRLPLQRAKPPYVSVSMPWVNRQFKKLGDPQPQPLQVPGGYISGTDASPQPRLSLVRDNSSSNYFSLSRLADSSTDFCSYVFV